ncbi:protein of unknown function [Georgfuchsia toluolica]|uniref:Uncharacterized protein n=1 Tax=Georgfuchsia toluolica TaxID=424218 RepID=A0A916J1Z1_9PROT|nr:protein of unknown function [Georgfuchsia toluolica]
MNISVQLQKDINTLEIRTRKGYFICMLLTIAHELFGVLLTCVNVRHNDGLVMLPMNLWKF